MAASHRSSARSVGSIKSSASSASVARARAKAEAAKVRASYAGEEAKLKMEKAAREAERKTREAQNQLEEVRIDTELEVLTRKREADAAIVEAQVLEEAAAMHSVVDEVKDESENIRIQRTKEYVQSQMDLQNPTTAAPLNLLPADQSMHAESQESFVTWNPPENPSVRQPSAERLNPGKDDKTHSLAPNSTKPIKAESSFEAKRLNHTMGVHAPSYVPLRATPAVMLPQAEPLAQYLARRDLVTSGLYQFDDKPENFRAWHSSFTNAAADINLTPAQELDLMIRWLGKESGEQVRRVRSVYINNTNLALQKAWERLRNCYAAPEIIERSLFQRLDSFPKISVKECTKLRELGDLLMEIQGAKEDGYLTGLSYLDTSRGIAPIVDKLPYGLQEKWVSSGSWFKEENHGCFPPFEYFCDFICHEAKKRNDPSFMFHSNTTMTTKPDKPFGKNFNANKPITVHKTDVSAPSMDPNKNCPLHNKPHPLKKCRTFRNKPLSDRKAFLKEKGICFKCCCSASHLAKDCKMSVKCSECGSTYHDAVMHPGPPPLAFQAPPPLPENGGEGEQSNMSDVSASCTEVCGPGQWGRSCSKICLAKVFHKDYKNKAIKAYVILDDQSNRSLARPEFFEQFHVDSELFPYNLTTCSGTVKSYGKQAEGFWLESLDGKTVISLPPLLECEAIPNNRAEIPTPDAVLHQPHLLHISQFIPDLDPEAEILLLLGRDVLRVHKVREQVNGPHNAPFAQRLDLGWTVIGEVCLGKAHKPEVNAFKTNIWGSGRHSIFKPCSSSICVKETEQAISGPNKSPEKMLGQTVFDQTEHDNQLALSREDILFLKIMDSSVYRDDSNSWVAPLPFREPRQRLPNNKEQAVKRFISLQRTLKRRPEMQEQYSAFMEKIFTSGHAEVAPPLNKDEECWYLPSFGVYHPQKPHQIRVVFDSSAKHCGVSLNDVLLTGPDLNNSLLGVILRFRKERVAILADIQQMFHCFLVHKHHRNFLRFLWYKDNDLSKPVIEYRMKVHVFGNTASPAVAIYGLRRAIRENAQEHGDDTVKFVESHFYMDDGLISLPSEEEAIDLLRRTQTSLAESNLRLHKFVSNSKAVTEAFSPEDCAPVTKDLDLGGETVPTQRSLGLLWEIKTDTFTFSVTNKSKPFTRRGILSTVNSVFDPLGLLAPVTIQGRALLRELTSDLSDWDMPLPGDKLKSWEDWKDSLQDLSELHIPRMYTTTSLSKAVRSELWVFSDASNKAIGAVAYIKTIQEDGKSEVGFVMGKAKLAPQSEPTIPRLELCAAVLAVEMADLIQDELDLKFDAVQFFTDSKVVLGYICNETKRFYTYVHNRVQRIRQSSTAEQWNYVHTEENPADHASRSLPASRLLQTSWFTGPSFLYQTSSTTTKNTQRFELIEPENDSEIRPQVQTCATCTEETTLSADRFNRFSTFTSLVRGFAFLIHMARSHKRSNQESKCKGWHNCVLPRTADEMTQARDVVLKAAQKAAFTRELSALQSNKTVPKSSPLLKLCPTLENDFICVGGRLKHSELTSAEKNPIILPKNSHISLLLTRHHHEQVKHQGRHLTEGAIRAAGLWILGGKTLINSVLHKCITCRKLRGKPEQQCMANLPLERLKTCPPFTYVGLDVFGPWSVTARRTRGGQAESKRWAIMFSCLSSRAVHVEVIESMDSSSCVNALRRFFALRGPAKQLQSDCGTNFIGACRELGMDKRVQRYLSEQGCSWKFNPPHASHMGGCWERMIGVARRILDSMLLQQKSRLTHEVLCTLMAEVTAIMNARPLLPVSADPQQPFILSPSMLLTQKSGVPPPPGDFNEKDLYTKQWKQVQALANQFWGRWSREYLPTLQNRQKWTTPRRNLQVGDLVLLRDKQIVRNCWPMARITATFPGKDDLVRKVEVETTDQGTPKTFQRPVTEVVLLLPKD